MLLRCDPTLPRYGTDPIQGQFQSFEAKPLEAALQRNPHLPIFMADATAIIQPRLTSEARTGI